MQYQAGIGSQLHTWYPCCRLQKYFSTAAWSYFQLITPDWLVVLEPVFTSHLSDDDIEVD